MTPMLYHTKGDRDAGCVASESDLDLSAASSVL